MREINKFKIRIPELGDRPDITVVSDAIDGIADAFSGTIEMCSVAKNGAVLTVKSSRTIERKSLYDGLTLQFVSNFNAKIGEIKQVVIDSIPAQDVVFANDIVSGEFCLLQYRNSRFLGSVVSGKLPDDIMRSGGYIGTAKDLEESIELKLDELEDSDVNGIFSGYSDSNFEAIKDVFDDRYLLSYASVSELVLATELQVGDIVDLRGYYEAGDGAHHKRKIASADDGSGVQLANGLWANIVHNGEVNVSWFGAKPFVGTIDDPQFDNKEIIQKALNYSAYKAAVVFSDLYNVDSTVIINSGNSIRGNVVSTGIRKGYHDDVKIGMYMQNTNGYILDSAIKKVATGELMFNACMDSSTVWDTGEYEGKVDVSIKDIGFYSNKWRSCFGGFNANGIVNLTIDNVKCLDMIVGVNVSGGWLARVEQLLSYCRYIGYNAYSMTSIETNNCYSTTVANKRLDYSNLGVYADNIPLHLKGTDILSQKNFAFISYDCGNLMTNCIAEGYTNGIGVYNDGFSSTVVEDTYVENVVNYMNYKGKGYFKTSIKNSAFVTNLFNIENTFTGTGENLFEVEYKSGTPKGQLGYTKAFDTITGATSPFIIGKGLDTAFLGNGASFVISNISARDGLVSTQKITTRPFETLDIGSGFYKHTTDLFRFNKTTINNITIPILECAVARATNNGIGNFRLYINPVNNTPTIQYYNSSGVLSSYELAQKTTVQILDTPYYTLKMQQENVYEDFVSYIDAKLEYERQQRESEEQRQLEFENREDKEQSYEDWLSTQPKLMPFSEPQPSQALLDFKKKYLG